MTDPRSFEPICQEFADLMQRQCGIDEVEVSFVRIAKENGKDFAGRYQATIRLSVNMGFEITAEGLKNAPEDVVSRLSDMARHAQDVIIPPMQEAYVAYQTRYMELTEE